MSVNVWTGSGRLGRDPETRFTSTGKTVINFSMAVDDGYGDSKTTTWVRVTAWEKTADFVQKYFKKGDFIIVTGRLKENSYTDKNGSPRRDIEVVAQNVNFGGEKREERAAAAGGDESVPF
jgi:single-strand DNA-binding protein